MSLRVDGPVKLFAMIQVFFQHSLTDDSTRLEVIESDATLCPRLVTQGRQSQNRNPVFEQCSNRQESSILG